MAAFAKIVEPPSQPATSGKLKWAGVALIVFVTGIVYSQCLSGKFIWDDDLLVARSNLIQSPDGLHRIWFTTQPVDYWPVTNSSFWLEWRLWNSHPSGYHITNLVLHIADSLLVWAVLSRLGIRGAFLGALLFAVHPVNVESVAWIAQRKNLLSLLFFLLSALAYFKAEAGEKQSEGIGAIFNRWHWLSLLTFLLAMLSKGSVAALPLMLLLTAWWQRGRITRIDWIRVAPMLAVAVGLTLVNIWFQSRHPEEIARGVNLIQRVLGAGAVVWFYLYKALWPAELTIVYPQWNIQPGELKWWLPLLAGCVVTVVLWRRRRTIWGRCLLFAWVFYCLALLPVMGFADVGYMRYSLVADHYQHIALLAVVAVVGAAWNLWWSRMPAMRWVSAAAVGVNVVLLGILTWQQSRLYAGPIELYSESLERNPDAWVLHNNLGIQLVSAGQFSDAISHYREAVRIKPDYAEAYNNLGTALAQTGRLDEAMDHFRQALKVRPDFAPAHANLGNGLEQNGQVEEAIAEFKEAVRLRPDYALALLDWGKALSLTGRFKEAIEKFAEAEELDPELPRLEVSYAATLAQMGQLERSLEHYQKAAAREPNSGEVQGRMAMIYARLERQAEAIAAAKKGLELAKKAGQTELAGQLEAWLANQQ